MHLSIFRFIICFIHSILLILLLCLACIPKIWLYFRTLFQKVILKRTDMVGCICPMCSGSIPTFYITSNMICCVQVLHDAFFKYQTKPKLTSHGDLYYEGKEFEVVSCFCIWKWDCLYLPLRVLGTVLTCVRITHDRSNLGKWSPVFYLENLKKLLVCLMVRRLHGL